jgi:hypothetical protein
MKYQLFQYRIGGGSFSRGEGAVVSAEEKEL